VLSTDYQKYEKEEGTSKKLEGGLKDLNHIIIFVLQCRIMSTARKKNRQSIEQKARDAIAIALIEWVDDDESGRKM